MRDGTRRNKKQQLRKEKYRALLTAGVFILLFGIMAYSFVSYALSQQETLFDNSYNGRESQMLAENTKGKILAADGEVLAETVVNGENETRNYPFKNVFAHIVGYDSMGGSGLDGAYNYTLIHADLTIPEKAAYSDLGQKMPGNNVITTLNPTIQEAADEALGLYQGAIIVSDPSTGAILAMVSKPDFDPNTIEKDWDSISQNEEESALLNRVTQGLYPPGSTFKIMDAVEYLEENPSSWQSYTYNCTGTFSRDGETIHCFHNEQHGTVDFMKSFAKSCNSSFANIGLSLNRQEFAAKLKTMMFGEELPYDLPSSVSTTCLTQNTGDLSQLSTDNMIQLAIGQGATGMSPLHLQLITAAIANDGVVMKPYVVDRVESATGTLIEQNDPEAYRQIMSKSTAQTMRTLMADVIEEGTASKLKGYSYTAAGKTGSAEYEDDSTQSHAWFTGYAPAEDPQVAITVIIEGAGSGGDYAVPIARRVLDAWFSQ